MQPFFATPRLRLRPVNSGDLEALQRLWSEASVRRYLFDDQPVSRVLAGEVLAAQLANSAAGLGLWMVERRADGQLLGCAGLYPVTRAADHEPVIRGLLEPLAALAPAWRRSGYAREALTQLLDYGFCGLGQEIIAGVTDVPNVESRRMLEALGFELRSEKAGPVYRQLNYLLQRDVWLARSPQPQSGGGS